MVGGRYGSSRGSTAKRLMTSSAAAAFSSRTTIRPMCRVSTTRRPCTSARSSGRPSLPAGRLGAERLAGSYQTRSRRYVDQLALRPAQRGQLAAEDAPVSRQMVLLSQSASGTGVWP